MVEKIDWNNFRDTLGRFLGKEPHELDCMTDLYNDIGIDSLGLFSMGMVLMKKYKCTLPPSAVASIRTVGGLFDELMKRNPQ
jgi:acyl carrier protein